jgi:hypothetical protein
VLLALSSHQTFCENLQKKLKTLNRNHHKKTAQIDNKLKTQLQNIFDGPAVGPEDLPDVPVYYEGWIKYFHYQDSSVAEKPKSFFRNDAFYAQNRKIRDQTELAKKDAKGNLYIPSETSFWVTVLKDTVNILSSRKNQIAKTIDSLNIDFIKPIPETKRANGGVKDFGKFNEGYCLQVLTTVPTQYYQMSMSSAAPESGSQEVWIFCSENLEQKRYLMSSLIGLKLKKQHKLGHFLDTKEANDDDKSKLESNLGVTNGDQAGQINTVKEIKDGYWVLLQDWSQCTLKCNGGLQYQQLMCVPPKKGGKACDGNPVRTRPCNSQPCPPVHQLSKIALNSTSANPNSPKMMKPIVKAMRVSQRPLRYDKCHIKEGDALMSKLSESAAAEGFEGIVETYPARMVMNNRTITIYQDDSYTTILGTFLLQNTKLVRITTKHTCSNLFLIIIYLKSVKSKGQKEIS